ncbi:MAG TPA: biosynthetic peptidoglycan transglycosylase [Polyangiaceae bacterium]|nr:biosynthetic peptidoglycan transglycosylase [Polyangiaceae bacterium]
MRSFNELLQSPRALKALVAGGSVLSLLVLGLLAAPALVRGKVEQAARARGFDAQVESVRVGWGKVWLRGVRVTSPGDDFETRLDALAVGLWSGAVQASGGSVYGKGDPTPLLRKLRGKAAGGAASEADGGRELVVDGVFVRWERDGARVEAFGARASRSGGELSLGADLVHVSDGKRHVDARGVLVGTVVRDGQRQLVRLQTTAVELVLSQEAPVLAPPVAGPAAPRGPPAGAETDGSERAAKLREARAVLLALVREGLAQGANLSLDGVSARVERAGETLSFGPSRLTLLRDKETLRASLSPSATEAGVTPLALSVTLPLTPGPVHVVAKGGPVSFSSLGVRVGQMGLKDVRQATLTVDGVADLSEDFESAELDGKVSVHGLLLLRKELSPQVVGPWSFDASLKARARLDGSELTVTSSEAHFGEVRAELSGQVVTAPGKRHVEGRLRVPLSGCQSMLDAMPNGLLPLVGGLKLSGSFGVDLHVRYDLSAPQDARVVLSVQNECKVREVPAALSPHRFERPFLREVKGPDGSPMSIESGPGTSSWVSLDDMSRHLESAVLICEDSRFHAHAGFDFQALENALKDDLKQGRFARGASTLSMQLAKNLYLGKEKTVGRKLQEALLTMLLEQQLDKRRILELYLNVVELGPGLYGVGDAAQYYFAAPAHSLTLGQSLYLASLLPNPTYSRFGPDGKLNAGWLNYLHRLMHIAHKIKRVDDVELQAALEEPIAFRVPGAAAASASVVPSEAAPEPPPPELDDAAGGP